MPINRSTDQQGISSLARSLRTYLETAQLFGEEDICYPLTDVCHSEAPRSGAEESASFLYQKAVDSSASPQNDRQEKKQRLDELYSQYRGCQNCPLGKTRQKIVFGMGSIQPKALFIGEGPGYEEDRTGLPFVGKAGTLLDNILKAIDLDRATIYIANIVKCHPLKDAKNPQMRGNDRPPEFAEIEACRPILDRQIEILDPPVICALGATAAKALLRTTQGIQSLRGKVYSFQIPRSNKVVPLVPTYHPAALLRNELLKKDVWHDMKILRDILRSL